MEIRETAHRFAAEWEGGVSEDKNDPGGLTMYGVATHFMTDFAKTAKGKEICRRLAIPTPISRASMLTIDRDDARIILLAAFFDGLDDLHPCLAMTTYDARLNCGDKQGIKFLQRAARINVPNLADDGLIGPRTRGACEARVREICERAIRYREAYYRSIAASNPKLAKFLRGWLNRAAALRDAVRPLLPPPGDRRP